MKDYILLFVKLVQLLHSENHFVALMLSHSKRDEKMVRDFFNEKNEGIKSIIKFLEREEEGE